MARKKTFAVIGLGRFGRSLCEELVRQNVDVLAIDVNEDTVKSIQNIVSHSIIIDSTDEEALKNIGIKNIDHVIVAIGDNVQSSILTTLLLKDLGVKEITVKATNEYHAKVLEKIGADNIVHPEKDMGKRVARKVVSDYILEYLELSDRYSLIEIRAEGSVIGKTLTELDIRRKFDVNISVIKRAGKVFVPLGTEKIENGDVLIIVGDNKDIQKFENAMIKSNVSKKS